MPRPIHRSVGDLSRTLSRYTTWPVLALCAALVLGMFVSSRLATGALFGLEIGQVLFGILIIALASYGSVVYLYKRGRAERLLAEAAAADVFWDEGALRARVKSLVEPYWRAVAAMDVAPLRAQMSADWFWYLDNMVTHWRVGQVRPVLLDFRYDSAVVVGLEDWLDNRRDRVSLRVDVVTAFHATDLKTGKVVEGAAVTRPEQQLWHFIRGEHAWLLDRVEMATGEVAYQHCVAFREDA